MKIFVVLCLFALAPFSFVAAQANGNGSTSCETDCFFTSCKVICNFAQGGAVCTCAYGFATCACGGANGTTSSSAAYTPNIGAMEEGIVNHRNAGHNGLADILAQILQVSKAEGDISELVQVYIVEAQRVGLEE